MRLYPAYKLEDVLTMYTSAFFQLYEEGSRLKIAEYRLLANIISVPHMEDEDRNRFINSLDTAAADPRDILQEDDYTGIEQLKGLLQ